MNSTFSKNVLVGRIYSYMIEKSRALFSDIQKKDTINLYLRWAKGKISKRHKNMSTSRFIFDCDHTNNKTQL